MAKAGRTAGIEPRCRKIAEQMGYELVEIAMDREPAGMMLRFYIDRPEGISLDDCEAYHKAVRALADEIDYDYMEVSSPGIDRLWRGANAGPGFWPAWRGRISCWRQTGKRDGFHANPPPW